MGRAFFIALSAFSRMKRGRGGAGCRFVHIRFLPYFDPKISPKTSPFFYSDKPQNFWGLFLQSNKQRGRSIPVEFASSTSPVF